MFGYALTLSLKLQKKIRYIQLSLMLSEMNTKYMAIIATMAVMLIGATALATTDSAFADGKKHYEKSQAISQANACGNGFLPENVFSQNIGSQVQGDENAVALDDFQD
jgi:hypothetical protein